MNWNSIVRTAAAFAMYISLVSAYFAGFSPMGFALFSALVLSLGLCIHSIELIPSINGLGVRLMSFNSGGNPSFDSKDNSSTHSRAMALVPSLSESMTQLHSLQAEINELQVQFAKDVELRTHPISPNGSAN